MTPYPILQLVFMEKQPLNGYLINIFFMTVSFNPILINTCIWLLESLKTVKIIGKNL